MKSKKILEYPRQKARDKQALERKNTSSGEKIGAFVFRFECANQSWDLFG